MEHGTVSVRVVFLLRSAEVQPMFKRFVNVDITFASFVPMPSYVSVWYSTSGPDMLRVGMVQYW